MEEKYNHLAYSLPYLKHYDIIMAYLNVLDIKPSKEDVKRLMEGNVFIYYETIKCPYSKLEALDPLGICVSVTEKSDNPYEVFHNHKSVCDYFAEFEENEIIAMMDQEAL